MSKKGKTDKDVKVEAIALIDGYIKGFAEIEPESEYWNGYRSGLKAMKEILEKIEIDDEKKESKVTYL